MIDRRGLLGLAATLAGAAALPATLRAEWTGQGRLLDYPGIRAAGLPLQHLSIWLPPGYDTSGKRYPVLYMHDGHNLFDPALSNFNKVWAADKAMVAGAEAGRFEEHIIVGAWAPGADRYRQYLPQPAYAAAPPALKAKMDRYAKGPIISQAYLEWLAGPLKQWVDASFRTRPGRMDTAIAGSSMGGLMSFYAFLYRPGTYGRAACVSSHWPAVDPGEVGDVDRDALALWTGMLRSHLGAPDGRRIWFDHGSETLDAFYAPYQQAIDTEMEALGWQRGRDWQSRSYPGAAHEENAWAARLPEVLGWLLS